MLSGVRSAPPVCALSVGSNFALHFGGHSVWKPGIGAFGFGVFVPVLASVTEKNFGLVLVD